MSLASKLFWNTLLVLCLTLGATGWLSIEEERAALTTIHNKYGNSIAQTLASFSAGELTSQDYPSLEYTLQSIGKMSGSIILLKVSRNGVEVASYGKPGDGLTFSADINLYNDGIKVRKIGEALVVLSKRDSETIIASRIRELGINSLVLFIALAIALYVLTHRIVLKRIALLTKATECVITGQVHDTPEHASGKSEGDELDQLGKKYTAMLDGLERRERERSAAVAIVQEARVLLDDVANSLPSSLIVLSADGRMEYRNQSALAFAENTPNDMASPNFDVVYPVLASDAEKILAVSKSHLAFEVHRKIWNSGRGQKILNIAVFPLKTRTVGGSVIRIDDVTERTRLEEGMIQSEKLVSVGGLAAGVAHEINNPLGVMIQAAQNIERRVSESIAANHRVAAELDTDLETIRSYLQQRGIFEFLDDIKGDGARAAKIVRSLLEFSRKSEPVLETTNLMELVQHAIELAGKDYDLQKKFDFRRIEVTCDFPEDLPEVSVIRSEVEQVILNLLKNSSQAMADKFRDAATDEKPKISIKARRMEGFVEILVQDNGPGCSEEARRRAFEPFFTTKEPGIGTGLGLWISYMIITEKHHGEMSLESNPGQGATFLIRLPL